ncbi:hypothetical protein [Hymenobacter sp. GOD-10R]|uniref:hypothetical protein n=1 Tax=Hymenobacter sp. GOD-10R TaxID=3093922 RepID=UPI002D781DAA|nr:hypothetical protein [Hymenobacter sp. GOD-10R]WRQ30650.1 hypothetical protein SD425_10300 [Hymenobacter sp. GOD-10R]
MLNQLRGRLLAAYRHFRPSFLLVSVLAGLTLQPRIGRAQQQADLVGWTWASVQWQPDSSRWALEISPNYVVYQNLTRTFLRLGLGRVSYAWPRQQLTLSLLYEVGPADQRGTLQLARLYLGQELATRRLHPRWQLSLDRLWFTPELFESQERPPIYRVRTLVGIVPPLSHHLSLVLNTEPFVYRTDTWLQEVRSQVGLQFAPRAGITAQALYWNWWAGYEPRRVRWQHTVLLTATFHLK